MKLREVPECIGHLPNLTSLNLYECNHLISIPTSLVSINHLVLPDRIADIIPIPSNMDLSQFKREVNVASYMEYMMRMNTLFSVLSAIPRCMRRKMWLASEDNDEFNVYEISALYGLIERREGRGNDLIGYLCLMLTNDWKMKRENGYVNEIVEWRNDEKKGDGMNCLKILYLNIYGIEMKTR